MWPPQKFTCLLDFKIYTCFDKNTDRYECIENDLLGCLQLGTHNIARYQSKGIERASELSTCWTSVNTTTDKRQRSDADTSGNVDWHFPFPSLFLFSAHCISVLQ